MAVRHLDGRGVEEQLVLQLRDDAPGVGAHPVHLVDEGDAGDLVPLHLAVDGVGLALDAAHCAKDQDGAVEDPQSALNLDGEIDVAGRVDDIDLVTLPLAKGGRGLDRNALFALQIHAVHLGADPVLPSHLVDVADSACVEENALCQRGFARIDVR